VQLTRGSGTTPAGPVLARPLFGDQVINIMHASFVRANQCNEHVLTAHLHAESCFLIVQLIFSFALHAKRPTATWPLY